MPTPLKTTSLHPTARERCARSWLLRGSLGTSQVSLPREAAALGCVRAMPPALGASTRGIGETKTGCGTHEAPAKKLPRATISVVRHRGYALEVRSASAFRMNRSRRDWADEPMSPGKR
jgi:hypothetical protein